MTNPDAGTATSALAPKVVLTVVIALVVGLVAFVSVDSVVVIVLAVAAAVGAFWILDTVAQPSSATVQSASSGGRLPQTQTVPLPPPGVDAAAIDAPTDPDAPAPGKASASLDPALFDPLSIEITTNLQGKSRVFSIRVAKHGNTIAECEDAVALDPRRGVLAVADGASSSFGAGEWADTLTKQFVQAPPKPLSITSFATWLAEARGASPEPARQASDNPNGWWSEEGARHGAFSTVVGAAIMTDGDARVATVMCLGDSCAFVLTGSPGERTVRRALPYEDASQFGSHPSLLASMAAQGHDEPTWTTIPTSPGDLLVLASDAVSEWLLGDPKRFAILDGHAPEAIANRLIGERTDGRLVNDDLTIALLELAS